MDCKNTRTSNAPKSARRPIDSQQVIGVGLMVLVAISLALAFYWETTSKEYTAAYLDEAGYMTTLNVDVFRYDKFRVSYGEPLELTTQRDKQGDPVGFTAYYPGFTLKCAFSKYLSPAKAQTSPYIEWITITGEQHRFGKLQIGVGSPRRSIRRAYFFDKRIDADDLRKQGMQAGDAYYADGWSMVLFNYDENNLVKTMRIGRWTA